MADLSTSTRKSARRRRVAMPAVTRAIITGTEDRLLKLDEVRQLAGIGKTMIYRLMAADRFPRACHPHGSTSSRWSEQEVTAWVREQLEARAA